MANEKVIWEGSTQLAPVPVVLVGTGDGKQYPYNVLTVAWAGTVCSEPPMVGIGIRKERFSYHQLCKLNAFTVNMPTSAMAETVDYCGVVSGRSVDKFAQRGLTAVAASRVTAPIVAQCPLVLECEVRQQVELGSHVLIIGEVKAVQVDASLVDDAGKLDITKADLLAYAHGHYFALGECLGHFGYSIKKK